jgi:hypothetical protein
VLEQRFGVTIEDDSEGSARMFASAPSRAGFVRIPGGQPGGQ